MMQNIPMELYKGISDLPIFLLAVFFAFQKVTYGEKTWSTFFFKLAASSLLGSIVHIFSFPSSTKKILWTILYVLLYETLRSLIIALTEYLTHEDVSKSKVILITEAVLFLVNIKLLFMGSTYDIYLFVIFGIFSLMQILKPALKAGCNKKLVFFFSFCVLAILFQALKTFLPGGVVFSHISIIFAIIALGTLPLAQ